MTGLSQSSGAIRSRRWRARNRTEATDRRPGRPVNFAQHEALIAAVERVTARRNGNLHILACDLGFAHRMSLMDAYRRAKAALYPREASCDPETGRSFGDPTALKVLLAPEPTPAAEEI